MRSRLVASDAYYGWVVTGACFLAAAVVFGMTYSFGVFFDALLAEFPGSARLSLVFGVQTFVIYVGAVAAGGLVDRFGPRRTLLAGAGLLAAGLVGAGRSASYAALVLSYGVVAGLGMSLVYVIAYATVPRWFGRRRGFANGIASSGLGVGLLIVAPAASWLIAGYGWRSAYLVLAGALAAVLVVAAYFLAESPAAVGVDASAEFPDGEAPGRDPATVPPGRPPVRAVARSPPFVLTFVGFVLVYVTLYVVMNHLVRYTADAGLARAVGVRAVSVIGVTTALSRLGIGFASDRAGRAWVFVACAAVMALTTLVLPAARGPAAVYAVAVAFGVGYGGAGALLSPLVADLFGAERLGTLYGLVSASFAVSGLLAPPLAGLGYDWLGTYTPVFAAAGAVGLAGTGLVAAAGRLAGQL